MGLLNPSGRPIISDAKRHEAMVERQLLGLLSACLGAERLAFDQAGVRGLETASFRLLLAPPDAILPPEVALVPGLSVKTQRDEKGLFCEILCRDLRAHLRERAASGEVCPEFGVDPLFAAAAGFRTVREIQKERRRLRRGAGPAHPGQV